MNEIDIVSSFDESFCSENMVDLGINIGDTCIDLLSKSEIIGTIPILGLLSGLYKIHQDVATARLIKKIYIFLFTTQELTEDKKRKFINELSTELSDRGDEFLLDLINRLDNIHKTEILANLVKHKVYGDLECMEFILLCKILENIPISFMTILPSYIKEKNNPGETDMLFSCGLLYVSSIHPDTYNLFKLNRNGYLLLKYGLEKDIIIPDTYPVNNSAYAVLS